MQVLPYRAAARQDPSIVSWIVVPVGWALPRTRNGGRSGGANYRDPHTKLTRIPLPIAMVRRPLLFWVIKPHWHHRGPTNNLTGLLRRQDFSLAANVDLLHNPIR